MKENKKKTLVLLDTHAIIHRAYHALPDFVNSKGEPTGAIYGLTTMLFKIINELKPDYIVACYDLPKKTFRHEVYEDYKAGRAKADEALVLQLKKSREFFENFNVPTYESAGFEADDLLGTIVEQNIKNKNLDIVIASGDMDTLQLVKGDRVMVYTLKKGLNDTILYNEKEVLKRFGFEPEYLPDYKGLRGDPSDNIIGIKGIGEKTATILIQKYKTIENIYKTLKKNEEELKHLGLTDRIIKLLKEGEDEAIFSKTLATIRLDAPIKFVLPEKDWSLNLDKEKITQFFQEMEFKSLITRLNKLIDGGSEQAVSLPKETKFKNNEDASKLQVAYWLLNSEKTNPNIEEIVGGKTAQEVSFDLEKRIEKENLDYVYREIELPIIPLVKEMENNGILIDKKYFKKLSEEYHVDLSKLEKEIWDIAGVEFNINSPKQLSEVLFEKLNLPIKGIKKSAGGSISTRESELEKLRELHPAISKILEYRELQKLLSTYIDPIPEMVKSDGRLHANFIQTGTTTGRFASSNPNLQNIPIKTEKGKNIRNAFIAEKGSKLASFDYSQVELRVAALLSQDPYFIKVFKEGGDIHQAVAMKVFGVGKDEVTHDMRRRAKVINFGILYGMGVNALRQNLGTDRKEAQNFYDNYFAQFPTIAGYLESIKNLAKKEGYTETLFGRRRYFPGLRSPLPYIRAMAERMAINAPIQGTATADIIKIGMKRVDEELSRANLKDKIKLVLQIHDELMYEIKDEYVDQAVKIIEATLKNVIPHEFLNNLESVPLEVSVSVGNNWGELK